MPTYAAPGVYVEEVASSQKVLSAAPTAIAAFVGFTERAPSDDPNDPEGLAPRLVTSWTQFEQLYGARYKLLETIREHAYGGLSSQGDDLTEFRNRAVAWCTTSP